MRGRESCRHGTFQSDVHVREGKARVAPILTAAGTSIRSAYGRKFDSNMYSRRQSHALRKVAKRYVVVVDDEDSSYGGVHVDGASDAVVKKLCQVCYVIKFLSHRCTNAEQASLI